MKRVGRVFVFSAFACVLALALAETLLRVFPVPLIEIHRRGPLRGDSTAFTEYDAELGWRGRPDARGSLSGWEFTNDARLNSRGFRDGEGALAKPPGVIRVVLLGDSITWGYGVEQTERYSDLVAEALRRRGLTVDVVNLAVSGYGTDQELLLWEREGRRYCADLVLLGLYENDLRENASAFQGPYPKPYFRRAADGALRLENVPVPRVPEPARGERADGLRGWVRHHVRVWAALAFVREAARQALSAPAGPPESPPGSTDLTAVLIERLAASIRRDGAELAVVVLPDLYYSRATMDAATRSGTSKILDLAAAFRRAGAGRTPLFYRLDGAHWTPTAHALAASEITKWMVTAGPLPRSPRACAGPS